LNGLNLPEDKRFGETYKLRQLSQELHSNEPSVCFIVSDKYSIDNLPGFMSIPYLINIEAFIEYYRTNKQSIQAKAKKVIEMYKPILLIKEKLQKKFQIVISDLPIDDKEWNNYEIALKHLRKLLKDDEDIRNKLEGMKILFGKDYKVKDDIIEVPLFFNDEKLRNLLS